VRSLDEDMKVVGTAIHQFLEDHREDHVDVKISDLTSMVFLGYRGVPKLTGTPTRGTERMESL